MKKFLYLVVALVVVAGCRKSQFGPVERTSGNADFTKFVSVGNSLTMGFQDNGLYAEAQEMSYPSIIAQQMKIVDPEMGDFNQPEVFGNGSGYMHLEYIDGEIEVIQPNDPSGYAAEGWDNWGTVIPNYYNNLGISGLTLDQVVALTDQEKDINNVMLGGGSIEIFPLPPFEIPGNPFARFLDFGGNSITGGDPTVQYIDHIRNSNATFFSCWLGNNDILGYAGAGGVSTEIDLSFIGLGTLGFNTLADPSTFAIKYDSVLTAFNDIGAKGVCATIPDVTAIPNFITFTPDNIVESEDFTHTEVWIEEYDGNVRLAISDDIILLAAKDTLDQGGGSSASNYLPNNLVLDIFEVTNIRSTTIAVNSAIKASAAKYDFAVVDIHGFVENVKGGQVFDGIDISAEYISGGGFSLDGVHMNPRGYAIVANEFIKAINDHYDSNIPTVAVGNYRGIVYP